MQNYWTKVTRRRLSRRRALALTGGATAAAAFLAACGGDDDDAGSTAATGSTTAALTSTPTSVPSGSTGTTGGAGSPTGSTGGASSSLVIRPEDTSGRATRGGTYKTSITADVGSWDIHTRGRWFGTLAAQLWQRLTVVEPGLGEPSSGNLIGDAAESWEVSGDGMTATFKVRPGSHFTDVAPVNGHELQAEDVVATWNRWRGVSSTRATIDNEVNPDAPVVTMTAPDSSTVVMDLAFPAVSLPSLFASAVGQAFMLTPREINDYDPRSLYVGSGAFQVQEHLESAYIHLERNPGYYHAERPFFDRIEYPIISEYSVGLAALKAGQLHTYGIRSEEILTTKSEQDRLLIYQSAITVPSATMFFGYRPGSAFLDERVRQAFSMTQDRDLFAEVWFNTKNFEDNGLPIEAFWNSAVPANEFSGWYLDPRDEEFGDTAKYYQLNLDEAKKLLSAAGYPDGFEYPSTYASDSYGPEYTRQFEIQEGMAAEVGFKPQPHGVIYQSDLIPNYQSSRGDFDGTGWMLRPQSSTDPIDKFAEYNFSGSGPNFIGYDVNGVGDHSGDPYVDDLIRKGKVETDSEARVKILLDLQRYFAEKMYLLRAPSSATGFDMMWPAVKNFRWFQTDRESSDVEYWWLDLTLPPEA